MLELLPLLVFTTCSGLAAGAYTVNVVCISGHGALEEERRPWLFPVVCLVILGVGLLGTLMHLGHPLRFMNGLANPGSMISQEAYWAMAFAVVLVADSIITFSKGKVVKALRWVGVVAGVGLMVVTSLAYFDSLGMPGWRSASVMPFIVFGDIAAGSAVALFLSPESKRTLLYQTTIAACIAWLVSIAAYCAHLVACGIDAAGAMVFGSLVGPIAATIIAALRLAGKMDDKYAAPTVMALAIVGLVIVRISFFLVGLGI